MTTITTSSGFVCEIDESALDDMELFEALCEIDNENIAALPRAVTMLLGAEQKKALYDHVRDPETGRVGIVAASTELAEIFNGLKNKKK